MNAKVNFSTQSEFLSARVGLSQTITIGSAANSKDHDQSVSDRREIKSLAALESIFLNCLRTEHANVK